MKRLTLTAVLAFLPLVFLSGCKYDHAALGRQKFEARDWQGAIEELDWAVKANPDDAASRLLLARALAKSAITQFDAKEHYRECRKSEACRKPASKDLINLLLREKAFDEAEAVAAEEIAARPDDADWLELRALVTLKRAEIEQAAFVTNVQTMVGQGIANWATQLIVKARTLPVQADYDAIAATTIAEMKRQGLDDSKSANEFATRTRDLAFRAQADFNAALARNPLAFRSLTELGHLAADRDDTPSARRYFTQVIEIDDSAFTDVETKTAYGDQRHRSVNLLSAHLEAKGRLAESIAFLAKELSRGKLDMTLEERLGRQYLKNGQFDEAGAIGRSLFERDRRNTSGNYLQGVLALRAGNHEEAITYLNRALVLGAWDPWINAAMARACVLAGRTAQADEHFRMALNSELSGDLQLNMDYAALIKRMTDATQAAQFLESRLKAAFGDVASEEHQRVLAEVQKLYTEAGFRATTLDEARNALTVNPRNPFAKLAVARFEHETTRNPFALTIVREVSAEFPGLADAWILEAQMLIDRDQGAAALQPLRRAAALRPDDPNIPWLEARVHAKDRRLPDARRSLVRALEIDPKLAGARLDLMEIDLDEEKYAAAETQGRALLERFPDDPRVHRGIGLARLGLKDPAGAIAPLRRAVESRPAELPLRLDLARALLEGGSPDQGRAELVGLAQAGHVPSDMRRRAAEALRAGGFFAEAAAAFESILPVAGSEAERVELGTGAVRARLAAGDFMGALDDLSRIKVAGRTDLAQRLFVTVAESSGAHREAAAQADILRASDGHDPDSLDASWRAHVAVKQGMKAVEDLDDLIRLKPERECELTIERTAALLAAGKVTEAKRAPLKPDSRPDADLTRYLGVRLELAIAADDTAAAQAALRDCLVESPGDPRPRLAVARALALTGKPDAAAQLIRLAPLRAPDEAGAILAAAILVAAGDPTLAAAVLDANRDRGGRVAAARGLVAVILEKDPAADARFAIFLDRVSRRDPAGAVAAASRLGDPDSIREVWRAIAKAATSKTDLAASTAQDLARARLFLESRVLADRAFTLLLALRDRLGARDPSVDLLRAWWKLELDEPKPALDIAVPLIEKDSRNPAVLLIASLAGVAQAGADAPTGLLNPAGQAPPAAYLSDFGRAMAHAGEYVAAARAWSKLAQPDEPDRQLHFLVAAERRDPKEAQAVLATLSAEAAREPALVAARLWTLATDDKTRGEASAAIKALAALPLDFKQKRLDAVLLFEAALVAGLPAEAAHILEAGLADTGISAQGINRFADVLRRTGADAALLARLDERLAVVDPSGKLRTLIPRSISLEQDAWAESRAR